MPKLLHLTHNMYEKEYCARCALERRYYTSPNSLLYICGFFRPVVAYFLPLYIIMVCLLRNLILLNVSHAYTVARKLTG